MGRTRTRTSEARRRSSSHGRRNERKIGAGASLTSRTPTRRAAERNPSSKSDQTERADARCPSSHVRVNGSFAPFVKRRQPSRSTSTVA
jgi:hypothetical protein